MNKNKIIKRLYGLYVLAPSIVIICLICALIKHNTPIDSFYLMIFFISFLVIAVLCFCNSLLRSLHEIHEQRIRNQIEQAIISNKPENHINANCIKKLDNINQQIKNMYDNVCDTLVKFDVMIDARSDAIQKKTEKLASVSSEFYNSSQQLMHSINNEIKAIHEMESSAINNINKVKDSIIDNNNSVLFFTKQEVSRIITKIKHMYNHGRDSIDNSIEKFDNSIMNADTNFKINIEAIQNLINSSIKQISVSFDVSKSNMSSYSDEIRAIMDRWKDSSNSFLHSNTNNLNSIRYEVDNANAKLENMISIVNSAGKSVDNFRGTLNKSNKKIINSIAGITHALAGFDINMSSVLKSANRHKSSINSIISYEASVINSVTEKIKSLEYKLSKSFAKLPIALYGESSTKNMEVIDFFYEIDLLYSMASTSLKLLSKSVDISIIHKMSNSSDLLNFSDEIHAMRKFINKNEHAANAINKFQWHFSRLTMAFVNSSKSNHLKHFLICSDIGKLYKTTISITNNSYNMQEQ